MVSVWVAPLASVPVIVKVTEALLEVLDILTVEFNSEEAALDKIPSIEKFPAASSVLLPTRPSGSLATDSATFTSPKLLVSDKLTVILDKLVLYVAALSILLSLVNSTTLTSFKLISGVSLTGAKVKLKVEVGDVAVLPDVGSCTTATTFNSTLPLKSVGGLKNIGAVPARAALYSALVNIVVPDPSLDPTRFPFPSTSIPVKFCSPILVKPLIRTWDTVSDASESLIVTFKSSSMSVSSFRVAEEAAAPVTVGASATALTVMSKLSFAGGLSSAFFSVDVTLVKIVAVPEKSSGGTNLSSLSKVVISATRSAPIEDPSATVPFTFIDKGLVSSTV